MMTTVSILLVDDEPLALLALDKLVRDYIPWANVAATACNGTEALALIRSVRPDLVISDIRMPHGTGIELIDAVRQEGLTARFIMLSAYREFDYVQEAMRLGAVGYLVKPISTAAFLEEMNRFHSLRMKEEEAEESSRVLRKIYPYAKESALKKWLMNRIGYAEVSPYFQHVPRGTSYRTFVARLSEQLGEAEQISIVEHIEHRFARQAHAVFYDEVHLIVLLPSVLQGGESDIRSIIETYSSTATVIRYSPDEAPLDSVDQQVRATILLADGDWETSDRAAERAVQSAEVPADKEDRIIRKVKQYCDEHYGDPLSLEVVANQIHMNKKYFSYYFKEKTGTNFWDYITSVRIRHAKRYLRETELRVGEISDKVGYLNPSHFVRLFKASTGMTPAEYRNRT